MNESLRGDLARKAQQTSEPSKLRGTLLRPSGGESIILDPLVIGTILVQRDGGDEYTIERINERKGKEPLMVLRGKPDVTISLTRTHLKEQLAEENGAWSYKNEPPSPKP